MLNQGCKIRVDFSEIRYASILAVLLIAASAGVLNAASMDAPGCPSRQDIGDLIVLRVCGSYYEMGRQQVELLKGEAPERYSVAAQYEFQHSAWTNAAPQIGIGIKLLDWFGVPSLAWLGPATDDSGFYQEIRGMGDGIGIGRADALRFWVGALLAGGSTVFVATRTATADGGVIVGRNVDWSDHYGLYRPTLVIYHPNNGDLSWISACWPLSATAGVGMNEAGLVFSFNFFAGADDLIGMRLPQFPHRLVLEKARTVEEATKIITGARQRFIAGFFSLADAAGNIGLVECTAGECAVYRPKGDWFALANNALTEQMAAHQDVRLEDSFIRRAAMEDAVRPHLGGITPQIASQILRYHQNTPYVDDPTVANPGVLNAVVIQPSSRTLWASTTRQPLASYGEFVPFTLDPGASSIPSLPPDSGLGKASLNQSAAILAEMRQALRLFDGGKVAEAGRILDAMAARQEKLADPYRLAWARARVRLTEGKLDEADGLLAPIDSDGVILDLRVPGVVVRAVIADRQGRRDDAIKLYRRAQSLLDANPQLRVVFVQELVTAGLRASQAGASLSDFPDLQGRF